MSVWCMVEDFEEVLRTEPPGTKVIDISRDDFMAVSTAHALGQSADAWRIWNGAVRLKEGIAAPEQNGAGT